MKAIPTELPGVLIIEPDVYRDVRGYFQETWSTRRYAEHGIGPAFVQDNLSHSVHRTLRGMHFQEPNAQGKLVYVLRGSVLDVVVDVRRESPTFCRSAAIELSEENHRQIWVPPGYAHGYYVQSEGAIFCYKVTENYSPSSERSVRWDDPELGIAWPDRSPIISGKDASAPFLKDQRILPQWQSPTS